VPGDYGRMGVGHSAGSPEGSVGVAWNVPKVDGAWDESHRVSKITLRLQPGPPDGGDGD
jgi:hypothetical protein